MPKTIADILQLGDPRLYEVCDSIKQSEIHLVSGWINDLHEAMFDIRKTYGFGRGIAAPQLAIMKRLVYINIDRPWVLINPEIVNPSQVTFELWDDCMSFPNLLVKVARHQNITLKWKDENWEDHELTVEGALSELIQHEVDHLDGILCTMRAMDNQSFRWKNTPSIL